ncbi:hypothetical protein OG948_02775 [Embleya sp. NBC_00888]|uniref:hypothetical protein n=1 Tax=Embleya sp. NBC_00888 TaxID=2975960 RepID=UPI0038709CFE|nr:hypothetical protein OG948_02775 [Embleya sp. NBC_00888]
MIVLQDEWRVQRGAVVDPTTAGAWSAFVRFGRCRFDTPDTFDADGLLFQYGTYSFDGRPTFLLDLTRQFEANDDSGDHDHYVQVHCELRYDLTASLSALGGFESWFFHDTDEDLDRWAEALTNRAAWNVLCAHKPAEIRIYREQV